MSGKCCPFTPSRRDSQMYKKGVTAGTNRVLRGMPSHGCSPGHCARGSAAGGWDVVVGTHAIVQDNVQFHDLALVITDEQHRFGVRQRELLSEKGTEPHVLAMSATPIPRTLALVLYGDMDLSVMDERPADRLPVKNCVVGTKFRPNAYHFMKKSPCPRSFKSSSAILNPSFDWARIESLSFQSRCRMPLLFAEHCAIISLKVFTNSAAYEFADGGKR